MPHMNRSWFVYIMTNHTNTVFYTGITNDPQRRSFEHRHDYVKNSFAGRYNLYKIVYLQEFLNPIEAVRAEKKIKGWVRKKKLNLIRLINPTFKDLLSLR